MTANSISKSSSYQEFLRVWHQDKKKKKVQSTPLSGQRAHAQVYSMSSNGRQKKPSSIQFINNSERHFGKQALALRSAERNTSLVSFGHF